MQTVFCDKHPLQRMDRVEFSKEGTVEADGFKCRDCNRVFILARDLGYLDFVNKEMVPNPGPRLCCCVHKSPLYIAGFELQGDESVREWRCAHSGCKETRITVGENNLVESAA